MDNLIVRTSEIGFSQPNRSLCIHMIVNNVILIKCQNHNYLILTHWVLWPKYKMHANTEKFKNIIYLAIESVKALADNVSF